MTVPVDPNANRICSRAHEQTQSHLDRQNLGRQKSGIERREPFGGEAFVSLTNVRKEIV